MKLKDWIKEKGWSKVEFAKRIGVSRATVYLWLNNKRPNRFMIKRIKEITNDEVKYKEISKTQVPCKTNRS